MHVLHPEDAGALQRVFEHCSDFAQLVDGEAFSPSAAEETFQELPPGKTLDDKLILGLVDPKGEIVGLLDAARGYPEDATWWIGLLLLTPEVRGQGLGAELVDKLAEYASPQGCAALMLGVVEANARGYRFWERQGFREVRKTEPRVFGRTVQAVRVMRRP